MKKIVFFLEEFYILEFILTKKKKFESNIFPPFWIDENPISSPHVTMP